GRKTGRGWYVYEEGQPHRPDDPEPPQAGGGEGRRVEIEGSGPVADYVRERAAAAGFGSDGEVELVVDATVPSPTSDVGIAPSGWASGRPRTTPRARRSGSATHAGRSSGDA